MFPNRTIRDNIAYGLVDVGAEEVEAAAREANAFEMICGMPHKFDTMLGAGGAALSGSQKQVCYTKDMYCICVLRQRKAGAHIIYILYICIVYVHYRYNL